MKTIATTSIDDRFDPPHSTIHVGQIKGGVATNIVADYCCFEWDIRVIPKDDIHQIFEDYYAFCAEREVEVREKYAPFKITNTLIHPPVPALDTKETDSIVGLLQKLTGTHTWKTVAYAAEAGQFHEAGYESIICGPGSIDQAHRANEFVTQEQLDSCVVILEKLIKEFS
jgi:acetylornithine deacetylase